MDLITKHQSRGKILALPYTHTLSHLSRPLAIAQELQSRGLEVVFGGESPKTHFLHEEGFEVFPVFELSPDRIVENARKGRLRFATDEEIDRMIASELALYEDIKPDLVLSDFRFTVPISSQIAGIKHAAIVNASSTEYRSHPYVPFFEWIPERVISRKSQFWKRLQGLNLCLEMFVFDRAMNAFNRLSNMYHLKRKITATNCLTGNDLTLLADLPEYLPTKNLPADYHYIGPITLKTNVPPPPWWPPKNQGRPLVYITMGTTGLAEFFTRAHTLMKSSDYVAVITTGGQAEGLKNLDGKIYVEDFIDGDLVMRVCDVVVCHGGNGTIYQALTHGKPVIAIPTLPDQQYNARRVQALGFGLSVSWRDFLSCPGVLLSAIKKVLETPSYTQSASRLQSALKKYNGETEAANHIAFLLAGSITNSRV